MPHYIIGSYYFAIFVIILLCSTEANRVIITHTMDELIRIGNTNIFAKINNYHTITSLCNSFGSSIEFVPDFLASIPTTSDFYPGHEISFDGYKASRGVNGSFAFISLWLPDAKIRGVFAYHLSTLKILKFSFDSSSLSFFEIFPHILVYGQITAYDTSGNILVESETNLHATFDGKDTYVLCINGRWTIYNVKSGSITQFEGSLPEENRNDRVPFIEFKSGFIQLRTYYDHTYIVDYNGKMLICGDNGEFEMKYIDNQLVWANTVNNRYVEVFDATTYRLIEVIDKQKK